MATIALYAGQLNVMPELIKDMKQSVSDYKTELSALWSKTITINKSICDLEEVIRIDREVAEHVRKRKEEFYDTYSFLKPECEKNDWEKFKDGCKKVSEWWKENWKSLAKILVTAVIIVGLGIATILTGGVLGIILAGAFWGALSGALIGGISGGIASAMNGGKFLEGFADGALSGVVSGAVTWAIFAGLGVAGSALGNFLGGSCDLFNYDPRYQNTPVLKDDYFRALKEINPDGFNVFTIQ